MSIASTSASPASIVVELYGVPRMRAGQRQYQVRASSVGEAMAALERECPQLSGDILVRGWPLPAYRLSLNGQFFVSNPALQLAEGDALLLIAADAGG